MVAVGIFIPDASDLTELHVRVGPLIAGAGDFLVRRNVRVVARLARHLAVLLREILAREQEHLLVEAADDGDLRLRRRRCLLLLRARLLR